MLNRLKAAHKKAVTEGSEIFMFDGHELLRDYAKYLIQYLETRL